MLIGKNGSISPEAAAAAEAHAEAQRRAAAVSLAEEKRLESLTNTQFAFEMRKAVRRASKCSGTGMKVNGIDFGPPASNGLDASYGLLYLAILSRDHNAGPGISSGAGRGGPNDPYCLRTLWRPKYGRKRNGKTTSSVAGMKKAA